MTRDGTAVSKEALIEAMKEYCRLHGMQDVTRITGHSMRTSGAQRWAAAGIDLEITQLFGRWECARQMMKYVREAALSIKCTKKIARTKRRDVSLPKRTNSKSAVKRWTCLNRSC